MFLFVCVVGGMYFVYVAYVLLGYVLRWVCAFFVCVCSYLYVCVVGVLCVYCDGGVHVCCGGS